MQLRDINLTADDIEDALSFIDCPDRTTWFRVAAALWHELGEGARAMWYSWGESRYEKWRRAEADQQWRSIRSNSSRLRLSTVIALALDGGWDWKSKARQQLTQAEQDQRARDREQREKEAAEATKRRQGEAAKLANEIWDKAQPVNGNGHAYLQRKGVHAHGLRLGEWPLFKDDGSVYKWLPGVLLVPLFTVRGKLRSLQAIFPAKPAGWESDKSYLKGGEKAGCFHMLGTPKPGQSVIFCEGYATGASIHEATGWCVVVVFDAGNIEAVAIAMADMMPGTSFVIAADNDRWSKAGKIENPGLHYAQEAGKVINCRVVAPEFQDLEGRPKDFNDLHQREGAAEVVRQLIPALPIAANDSTPPDDDEGGALVVPPEDVDRFGLPDQGGRGAVLGTVANLREICRRLRVTIRYNEITKAEEILIPGTAYSPDHFARASLAKLKDECILFRMPTENVRNGVLLLAEANHFNPVQAWVTSRPWDGHDRLPQLNSTLTMADPAKNWLRDALIRRWMVTCIAAAFNPEGVAAQGMLVLQGPQNLGKTRWLMSLTPKNLRLAKEGQTLNPNDRDSVKQATQFWLVELGELDATFRKSDIAALKSFITRESDIFRKAYAEDDSHFARRTVFFGSVNPKHFLHDPTGARRFWTLEVADVDHIHQHIDMQQVWAQVLELWKAGEQIYLTPQEHEALSESNEEFQAIDPVQERIQTRLDWGMDEAEWKWRTTTDVLMEIGFDRPTQSDCTKAADFIAKMNGDRRKRSGGKRLLFVPRAIPHRRQDEQWHG